jgi:hypothetical protein
MSRHGCPADVEGSVRTMPCEGNALGSVGTGCEHQFGFGDVKRNIGESRWNTSNRVATVDDIPEAAYGRVTNPQRFEPLIAAGRALVADLERRFEVTVTHSVPPQATESTAVTVVDIVHINPALADQAPLTIAFTSFPGLYLDIGAWEHVALPSCGCDACDEDASSTLASLSRYCEATAAGQLSERISGGTSPTLKLSWKGDDWASSTARPLFTEVTELQAHSIQPPTDGRWQPWSPRSQTAPC